MATHLPTGVHTNSSAQGPNSRPNIGRDASCAQAYAQPHRTNGHGHARIRRTCAQQQNASQPQQRYAVVMQFHAAIVALPCGSTFAD